MISQILAGQELTDSEKIRIPLTEIAKGIKQQLKKEYPLSKFSIATQFYSGGCSLHISIMETDFKIIKPFNELNEDILSSYLLRNYTKEQIKAEQEKKHFQLSHLTEQVYNPNNWNNGVFLTEAGFNLVKRIIELTNKFNYDNSDSQIDYFDVNFYLHLNIGKWDKPYNEVLK